MRAWLLAAAVAATVSAIPSQADAACFPGDAVNPCARDGLVEQAIFDTVLAAANRQGQPMPSDLYANIQAAKAAGPAPSSGPKTWWAVLKGLGSLLPWPLQLGVDGRPALADDGSPYFGGGGASGSWTGPDCGDIVWKFDPEGNFVIPSSHAKFDTGAPIALDSPIRSYQTIIGHQRYVMAHSLTAMIRRILHLSNVYGPGSDRGGWSGVADLQGTGSGVTFRRSHPAYYTPAGVLMPSLWASPESYVDQPVMYKVDPYTALEGAPEHRPCPDGSGGSADIHFYGGADSWQYGVDHMHTCTWYIPDTSLAPDGYAINPEVIVPLAQLANWPNSAGLPDWMRRCPIDRAFLAKVADALTPGLTVAPEDARPGEAKVVDLGDEPATQVDPPTPDPDAPVPEDPTPPSTGGGTDVCDFGVGGCDNPNTPAPTLDEPPTGIMDPIFDWLPDLPSITLPDLSSECPVWNINLTAYGGPEWQFLLDQHCQLVEYDSGHGTVRAGLSALFLALWGLAAGLIILRA